MTDSEKKMLEANKRLLNQRNEMFKDIVTLIRYINGHKELKEDVKEVIRYYREYHLRNKPSKLEKSSKHR